MNKDSEVQKKYMELQMMQVQLQQIHQQVQALDSQANEMDLVQQALDDFSGVKVGSDMFVTLTPGLFAKAKLEANESVLLNVGAGAVVEKKIPDAKNLIKEQADELRKLRDELGEQLNSIAKRTENVNEELRKLIK